MTEIIHLTKESALGLLDTIVDRAGADHIVDGCFYANETDDGLVPVCLIGHLFAELDPSGELLEKVHEREGATVTALNFNALGITADLGVVSLLHDAQIVQDEGETWGTALERVKNLSFERKESN